MRPTHLNPFFGDLQSLPGIGPKTLPAYRKLLGVGDTEPARVLDLMLHMPSGVIDRRSRPAVRDAIPGTIVTLTVRVLSHRAPAKGSRAPYRVVCEDDTATLTLVFFNAHTSYLEKQLPVGETRIVSGRLELFNDTAQIVHPDHIVSQAELANLPLIEPVYPLTAGLSAAVLRRSIRAGLKTLSAVAEWIDPPLLSARAWPSFRDALETVHAPSAVDDCEPSGAPWQRLAYDELLSGQLALALLRRQIKTRGGVARAVTGEHVQRIEEALPFSLTLSQQAAISDIRTDLTKDERMLRLLQGDVGAGKTVVAVVAMAMMAEAGLQSAMMAPTEILARQHAATIAKLVEPAGLRVQVLTAREKGAERKTILADLAAGNIDILVGTHALFQAGVDFKSLGLAVIDEQHRFGVHQRLALAGKGDAATEILIMTATPIPRTLVLTYFGDMDVSKLTEKPAGRIPVETRLIPHDRVAEVMDRLAAHVDGGGQAFWVCPLVEEGEMVDAVSAVDRHRVLAERLGDRTALIHGRLSGREKDDIMARFAEGAISVLVATTVIEVGVDVPNASIMVIENAERFGLAQLHQLRGRVGRGAARSTCLLVYGSPLSETAEERLRMMRETEDGFLIAETDLRLRGGGEILGTRQSGSPMSRVAVPEFHADLLAISRKDAQAALAADPDLSSKRGQALRSLLHLFERAEALRLIEAG